MCEVFDMNKFLLSFLLLLSMNLVFQLEAKALSNNEILNKIENSLYGFEYSSQDINTRLNRIEESVYGKPSSSKDTNARISKLNKDVGAEYFGQEIEPCTDTLARAEDEKEVLSSQDPNIDYPVINALENSVFQKEYKNLGVKDRLSQLENKIFSKNYATDDLATRVERLQNKVQPESTKVANKNDDFNISGYYPPAMNYDGMSIGGDYTSYDTDYYDTPSFRAPAKQVNLASVEKSLYKQTFKADSTANRLSRIEQSMFGESFTEDSDQTRLARISSAYNAQKSASKYDSNKFNQNMATAMQIGTMILMILACIL